MSDVLTLDELRIELEPLVDVDPSQIGDEDDLSAYGLDSVRMMMMLEALSDRGWRVELVELASEPTLRQLSRIARRS